MSENTEQGMYPLAKRYSWIIGVVYAVAVGAHFPEHFQVTLLFSLLTLAFIEEIRRGGCLDTRSRALAVIGLINAAGFTLISNHRVQDLHWLVAYTVSVCLMLAVQNDKRGTENGLTLAYHMCRTPFELFFRCLRKEVWHGLCSFSFGHRHYSLDPSRVGTLAVSTTIAIVVTALLGQVNSAFAYFINTILKKIYDLIWWILSLEFIESALIGVIVAAITYALLTPPEQRIDYNNERKYDSSHYTIVILPLLVLLFVFCCFQMEFLGIDPAGLSYKELSNYVRKGFFELLQVAIIGALIWYLADRSPKTTKPQRDRIRLLLFLFAIELFLLSLFSHHKLFAQQIIFGLRDQRLLASAGTLLLTGSFLGFLAVLFKKLTHRRFLELQFVALVLITFICSYGNLDSIISATKPLRFEHQGQLHKDHAYLLTNSYDNADDWLSYVREVRETGVIQPSAYYWGVYSPLCYKSYHNGAVRSFSSFKEHINKLQAHYHNVRLEQFRMLFEFNLREYLAYRHIQEHRTMYNDFIKYLDSECTSLNSTKPRAKYHQSHRFAGRN